MKLLPLQKLGARETSPGTLDFGLFLPDISPDGGYRLFVKIIHEADQFLQKVSPRLFPLDHTLDPEYGDYWSARISITRNRKNTPGSAWGRKGRYVYRYLLTHEEDGIEIDWIIDPFAREFGTGKLSAITLGYSDHPWNDAEKSWKTPPLSELIVYELMISEFCGNIQKVIQHLDYLADLGITCLEIMPVSNCTDTISWGFSPVGYFGVDERFGNRKNFQKLVNEAHKRGMAVLIDSVYAHTAEHFPYFSLYRQLGMGDGPISGPFAEDRYGNGTDFRKALTQDFFFTVNIFWLDKFHVDGFRYDYVPGYYDGPLGEGYAKLVYHTYQAVNSFRNTPGYWQRFFDGNECSFIQCAEDVDKPVEILEKTYSTCGWQDTTLHSAGEVAAGKPDSITLLGHSFGLSGFPESVSYDGDILSKSAFQYLENHDHARFICTFGCEDTDRDSLLWEGKRDQWFRLQPYLIGLFTAKGIPFLWQGQEFLENYYIPCEGWGRVKMFRPVRWDHFYSHEGRGLLSLVRNVIRIRKDNDQFRKGSHYFYDHYDNYQSNEVMLFSRSYNGIFSLIALNFSNTPRTVPFRFPLDGNYREELHGTDNLSGIVKDEETFITIPDNYGRIWTAV